MLETVPGLQFEMITLDKGVALQLDCKWSLTKDEFEGIVVHGRVRGRAIGTFNGNLLLATLLDGTVCFVKMAYNEMMKYPLIVIK